MNIINKQVYNAYKELVREHLQSIILIYEVVFVEFH